MCFLKFLFLKYNEKKKRIPALWILTISFLVGMVFPPLIIILFGILLKEFKLYNKWLSEAEQQLAFGSSKSSKVVNKVLQGLLLFIFMIFIAMIVFFQFMGFRILIFDILYVMISVIISLTFVTLGVLSMIKNAERVSTRASSDQQLDLEKRDMLHSKSSDDNIFEDDFNIEMNKRRQSSVNLEMENKMIDHGNSDSSRVAEIDPYDKMDVNKYAEYKKNLKKIEEKMQNEQKILKKKRLFGNVCPVCGSKSKISKGDKQICEFCGMELE